MESKEMDINFLEKKWFALARISKRIELGNVFRERSCEYLNELHLFMAHFNSIPNVISEKNIDCKKAGNWLKETFKMKLKTGISTKDILVKIKSASLMMNFIF